MKTIRYKDFELDLPTSPVSMTHSIALDLVADRSSNQNIYWTDTLVDLPWRKIKPVCPTEYDMTCRLFSLIGMNYQVCNGGISQYFFNQYDKPFTPMAPNLIARYDLDTQRQSFFDLVAFASKIFPERTEENKKLSLAATAFKDLIYEPHAQIVETIQCEEDEFILDEETGETIKNPDWFEPYEDVHYEDVVHGGDLFETLFDDVNEYMEELFEINAQWICKSMSRSLGEFPSQIAPLPAAAWDFLWITVYKDTLGHPDDLDNLTAIKVPTKWLLPQIAESVMSTEEWFAEYTADWTDDIARKALEEDVILDCTDPEIRAAISRKTPSLDSMIQDAKGRKADSSSHINAPAHEQEH